MPSKITKTTSTTKRTSKTPAATEKTRTRAVSKVKQKSDQGSLMDQDDGESTGKHIDEGDLQEETLDRNAPYNKTYGRADE